MHPDSYYGSMPLIRKSEIHLATSKVDDAQLPPSTTESSGCGLGPASTSHISNKGRPSMTHTAKPETGKRAPKQESIRIVFLMGMPRE